MLTDLSALIIGITIGFTASLFGGVISYWVYLRGTTVANGSPKEFFISVMMILIFVGITALIAGAISGNLMPALLMGVGVSAGFTLAFTLLFLLYLMITPTD